MIHKGYLFVISGPSAVGKTSVVGELLKIEPSLSRIITCTTRKIRSGERDGVDYFFFEKDEFLKEKEAGDFVEFSEVYGNYYGVLLETIKNTIEAGKNSILTISWEGFLKIKKIFPDDVFGIFLLPPTFDHLEQRIRGRSTDSEEIIQRRLLASREDLSHAHEFDHQVVNDSFDEAVREVLSIIRMQTRRQ